MKKTALYLLLAFLSLNSSLKAQTYPDGDTLHCQLSAIRIDKHIIRLRWAPLNYSTWLHAKDHGFTLSRYTIIKGGEPLEPDAIEETKKTWDILARPKEELFEKATAFGGNWAIAYAAYYEPTFEASTSVDNSVKAFNITKERENRYGFSLFACDQSFDLAKDFAFAYEDQEEVEFESRYLYVLTPKDKPDNLLVQDATFTVEEKQIVRFPSLPKPIGKSGDKTTFINCILPKTNNPYISYNVQRSIDGINFSNVNRSPLINTNAENDVDEQLTFADNISQNGVKYYYRVCGNTPYDIQGPMSDTIQLIGKPKQLDATPYILDILPISNTFQVKWEFPDAMNTQISGFEIWRSRLRDEEPIKIAGNVAANLRQYTDNQPMTENYYQIVALDKNGYRLSSLPKSALLKDATPPSAPTGLQGNVDKSGNVKLSWTQNNESDLQGYRVFACDHLDGEYSEITRYWIKDNTYTVKTNLNTLAEKLFYKVCALDYHENQSKPSAPLTLSIPDIVPPVRPVLISLTPKTTGIQVDWEISSSEDVITHQIQRKRSFDADFITIATINNKGKFSKTYLDTAVVAMAYYDYRIKATDDAGLTSVSITQNAQAVGSGFRPNVSFPDAIYDVFAFQNTQAAPINQPVGAGRYIVKIAWFYNAQNKDVQEFAIYRTIGQGGKGGTITGRTVLWKTLSVKQCLYNGKNPPATINITPQNQLITGTPIKSQSTKGLDYYLVEDNDMNLINQVPHGNLHYQIIALYDDGTTSQLSPFVTAH